MKPKTLNEQITKDQHYVWRHYLEAWNNDTLKKIYYYRDDVKKVSPASPKSVGKSLYFYECHELTQGDLNYMKALISQFATDELKDMAAGWVEFFQQPFHLRKWVESKIGSPTPDMQQRIEEAKTYAEKMIGERYHAMIETKSAPILKMLREGKSDFYNSDSRNDFFFFLCNQYFRTSRMLGTVTSLSGSIPDHDPLRTALIENVIWATNVSAGLVAQADLYKIVFLHNCTAVPFVTGDQPVINMLRYEDKQVELYYPVSPKIACVLTCNNAKFADDKKDVNEKEVEFYNLNIFANSEQQTYSNNRSYLEELTHGGKPHL